MKITAAMVKELRDKTNVGMMECKKALQATDGDMEKAIIYLRERGAMKAAKKADREAKEGRIAISLSDDKKKGAILELNCETDFVANNENFGELAKQLSDILLENEIESKEAFLDFEHEGRKIKEILSDNVLKMGENINIGRFAKVKTDGILVHYLHLNANTGVIVDLGFDKEPENIDIVAELGKELALQITAMNPRAIDRTGFDKETLEKEKEILRNQLKDSKKPANIIDKIVEGRMSKFFQENTLLEQIYVKDNKMTVGDLVKTYNKKAGVEIKVNGFVRYHVGN